MLLPPPPPTTTTATTTTTCVGLAGNLPGDFVLYLLEALNI